MNRDPLSVEPAIRPARRADDAAVAELLAARGLPTAGMTDHLIEVSPRVPSRREPV